MSKKSSHITKSLLPIAWLYGFVVYMRKKLFDWKILKRVKFDIPVICVGNITVGGTGKTPHVEYLIRLLKDNYKVAVLSRGYKRKTKGFILSDSHSTALQIGDEPFQIKTKFPDIIVAVDANRRNGIKRLMSLENKPDVILLDDAFQHLYVKPSYSIVLTDYNRPIHTDTLLPAGRLRESASNIKRAKMVIVTKCPDDLKPIEQRILTHELNLYPFQILLHTTLSYGNLTSVFSEKVLSLPTIKDKQVLLVTGIASPEMLIKEIKKYTFSVELMNYPDHYNFTAKDIRDIEEKFNELKKQDKETFVIITEKDAARFINRDDLSDDLKECMYYLPIEVKFITEEEKDIFNKEIIRHVRKNTGNR